MRRVLTEAEARTARRIRIRNLSVPWQSLTVDPIRSERGNGGPGFSVHVLRGLAWRLGPGPAELELRGQLLMPAAGEDTGVSETEVSFTYGPKFGPRPTYLHAGQLFIWTPTITCHYMRRSPYVDAVAWAPEAVEESPTQLFPSGAPGDITATAFGRT